MQLESLVKEFLFECEIREYSEKTVPWFLLIERESFGEFWKLPILDSSDAHYYNINCHHVKRSAL